MCRNLLKCLLCHSDFLKEWKEIEQSENPFWYQCFFKKKFLEATESDFSFLLIKMVTNISFKVFFIIINLFDIVHLTSMYRHNYFNIKYKIY